MLVGFGPREQDSSVAGEIFCNELKLYILVAKLWIPYLCREPKYYNKFFTKRIMPCFEFQWSMPVWGRPATQILLIVLVQWSALSVWTPALWTTPSAVNVNLASSKPLSMMPHTVVSYKDKYKRASGFSKFCFIENLDQPIKRTKCEVNILKNCLCFYFFFFKFLTWWSH